MFIRSATVVLATTILLQTSPNRPIGVLVGLHSLGTSVEAPTTDSDPPSAGRLRTIWIPIVGTTRLTSIRSIEVRDLLIPSNAGFLRAGLLPTCSEEPLTRDGKPAGTATHVGDRLWIAPLGTRPRVSLALRNPDAPPGRPGPCVSRDIVCEVDSRTSVYWVSRGFLSLDLGLRSQCAGQPEWKPGYTIRSTGDLGTPMTMAAVLGNGAEQRLRRGLERMTREAPPAAAACLREAVVDPTSWFIRREPGAWSAVAWSRLTQACGDGVDLTVDVDVSDATGRDSRSAWQTISKRATGLTDAHAAPGGRWVLGTSEERLLVFTNAESVDPTFTIAKSPEERVVMVEWALGDDVPLWGDEVIKARNQARVDPVVEP
jgi:hypothetical protein